MKYLILAAVLTLTSCANFADRAGTSLAAAQGAAVAARETLLPVVDGLCVSIAQTCRDLSDTECEALVTCQDVRRKTIKTIIAVHYAILDANTALAIGDEESTWAAIDKSLELIRQLRIQMQELGIGA